MDDFKVPRPINIQRTLHVCTVTVYVHICLCINVGICIRMCAYVYVSVCFGSVFDLCVVYIQARVVYILFISGAVTNQRKDDMVCFRDA